MVDLEDARRTGGIELMYLIEPNGQVSWTDIPESMLLDAVKEHDADLGKLDWRDDTERKFTDQLLQIAIRHGVACSTGIAIPVSAISSVEQPAKLLEAHANVAKSQQNLGASENLMEALAPGWKADTERLNSEIAKSTAESVERFQRDADKVLNTPINEELVVHWQKLGGYFSPNMYS